MPDPVAGDGTLGEEADHCGEVITIETEVEPVRVGPQWQPEDDLQENEVVMGVIPFPKCKGKCNICVRESCTVPCDDCHPADEVIVEEPLGEDCVLLEDETYNCPNWMEFYFFSDDCPCYDGLVMTGDPANVVPDPSMPGGVYAWPNYDLEVGCCVMNWYFECHTDDYGKTVWLIDIVGQP